MGMLMLLASALESVRAVTRFTQALWVGAMRVTLNGKASGNSPVPRCNVLFVRTRYWCAFSAIVKQNTLLYSLSKKDQCIANAYFCRTRNPCASKVVHLLSVRINLHTAPVWHL